MLSSATCLSRRDLGLWLLAMDALPDRAVVLTQAGELHQLSWDLVELERYLPQIPNPVCR